MMMEESRRMTEKPHRDFIAVMHYTKANGTVVRAHLRRNGMKNHEQKEQVRSVV